MLVVNHYTLAQKTPKKASPLVQQSNYDINDINKFLSKKNYVPYSVIIVASKKISSLAQIPSDSLIPIKLKTIEQHYAPFISSKNEDFSDTVLVYQPDSLPLKKTSFTTSFSDTISPTISKQQEESFPVTSPKSKEEFVIKPAKTNEKTVPAETRIVTEITTVKEIKTITKIEKVLSSTNGKTLRVDTISVDVTEKELKEKPNVISVEKRTMNDNSFITSKPILSSTIPGTFKKNESKLAAETANKNIPPPENEKATNKITKNKKNVIKKEVPAKNYALMDKKSNIGSDEINAWLNRGKKPAVVEEKVTTTPEKILTVNKPVVPIKKPISPKKTLPPKPIVPKNLAKKKRVPNPDSLRLALKSKNKINPANKNPKILPKNQRSAFNPKLAVNDSFIPPSTEVKVKVSNLKIDEQFLLRREIAATEDKLRSAEFDLKRLKEKVDRLAVLKETDEKQKNDVSKKKGKSKPTNDKINVLAELNNELAMGYENVGEHKKAIKVFKEALAIDKKNLTARFHLAQNYSKVDEYGAAIKIYKTILKDNPKDTNALWLLGDVYETTQLTDQAIEVYSKMIRSGVKNPLIYFKLAMVHLKDNNFKLAAQNFRRTIDSDPTYVNAYYNLGLTYAYDKKIDLAIKSFKDATYLDPKNADSYYNLGLLYSIKEDKVNASLFFDKANNVRVSSGNKK